MHRHRQGLRALCLIIVLAVASCEGGEAVVSPTTVAPSPAPSPTAAAAPIPAPLTPEASPTLHPPRRAPIGFSVSDCLLEQQMLPYPCGVVPGQMTVEQVQERLGEPETQRDGFPFIHIPGRWRIDEIWNYAGIGVYLDDETVLALKAQLGDYELTLGEAVDVLGPPERIILFHEEGAWAWLPESERAWRANGAFFLWPDQGISLQTGLYATQGVGLDVDVKVPLFLTDLSIGILVAFEPCTLEEMEVFFQALYPPGPWIRWIEWRGWQNE